MLRLSLQCRDGLLQVPHLLFFLWGVTCAMWGPARTTISVNAPIAAHVAPELLRPRVIVDPLGLVIFLQRLPLLQCCWWRGRLCCGRLVRPVEVWAAEVRPALPGLPPPAPALAEVRPALPGLPPPAPALAEVRPALPGLPPPAPTLVRSGLPPPAPTLGRQRLPSRHCPWAFSSAAAQGRPWEPEPGLTEPWALGHCCLGPGHPWQVCGGSCSAQGMPAHTCMPA